ncbi:alpha/beta fold hydrolase [Halorarum salinum]|uniref:alpha/beta fold hydrolase n=1 Tax=Halorarum salinum TaxID=2743089 RepID=UPI001C52FEAD|nr:alpha/beta hydrolase [Halobaculum salinum]
MRDGRRVPGRPVLSRHPTRSDGPVGTAADGKFRVTTTWGASRPPTARSTASRTIYLCRSFTGRSYALSSRTRDGHGRSDTAGPKEGDWNRHVSRRDRDRVRTDGKRAAARARLRQRRRSRLLGGGRGSARARGPPRVYAVERRGRGESGDSAGYELEREAEDVAAVVGAIGEPATLLGHSGGALYALEAALRTDDLRALVPYEPPIQVGGNELDVAEEVAEMRTLVDRGESERAFVSFQRDVVGLPDDEIDALRSAPIWGKMVDAARTLPRELRAIAEYRFEPARFADVTVPTPLLSGGESPPFFGDATEALPDGRVVTFEGEGHMAVHTASDRFVDEVLGFVRDTN